MTAVYGCIICGTARPAEMDWDWIARHRAMTCPEARWGCLDG